jgi:F-type H+-transporting ATPase subunit epsilon
MASTLKLEIVTPQGSAYSEPVEMVTLPGVEGQFGVYPEHMPLMTQMVPGEIIIRQDARAQSFAVGEGMIEVTRDHVSILTDMAIHADHIDEAKVEEARRRAEARLHDKLSDEEVASINASIARAVAQLHVKRRHR